MSRQRVKILQQHGALSIKSIMLHHIHRKPFTVNVLKFQMLVCLLMVIRAGINKLHVRIVNSEYPDHTASSEAA